MFEDGYLVFNSIVKVNSPKECFMNTRIFSQNHENPKPILQNTTGLGMKKVKNFKFLSYSALTSSV